MNRLCAPLVLMLATCQAWSMGGDCVTTKTITKRMDQPTGKENMHVESVTRCSDGVPLGPDIPAGGWIESTVQMVPQPGASYPQPVIVPPPLMPALQPQPEYQSRSYVPPQSAGVSGYTYVFPQPPAFYAFPQPQVYFAGGWGAMAGYFPSWGWRR